NIVALWRRAAGLSDNSRREERLKTESEQPRSELIPAFRSGQSPCWTSTSAASSGRTFRLLKQILAQRSTAVIKRRDFPDDISEAIRNDCGPDLCASITESR